MIHDTLINAPRYSGLHRRFAQAFAWCKNAENLTSSDGKYNIDGDQLFVIVESGLTIDAQFKKFESHRRYIDIQVNLQGPEIMEWITTTGLTVSDDFQPDNDICFYHHPSGGVTRLLVRPLEFALFWPEDAHKPCCHPGNNPIPFRKLIFKVAV